MTKYNTIEKTTSFKVFLFLYVAGRLIHKVKSFRFFFGESQSEVWEVDKYIHVSFIKNHI